MTRKAQTISLIGAGLNGPLLALGLVKRGFRVEIYERRPDMRRVRMSAGRSINLALSTRGIHALTQAGLWNEMRKIIIPMKGRMMHSATSELTFQPYGKDEAEVINSISRAELNIALMNAAEAQGVKIHFQQRCTGIDLKTGTLQVRDERTRAKTGRLEAECGDRVRWVGVGDSWRNAEAEPLQLFAAVSRLRIQGTHDSRRTRRQRMFWRRMRCTSGRGATTC